MRLTDSQIFWVTIVLAIFPMRASSEDIPKIMLGEWVEPGTGCPGNIVELYRDEGKIRISGGSGDTFCTWTNGRVIARSSEQIIEFKPTYEGRSYRLCRQITVSDRRRQLESPHDVIGCDLCSNQGQHECQRRERRNPVHRLCKRSLWRAPSSSLQKVTRQL
jgi:hypothetical protein